MIRLYVFNEGTRAANYGIGTYIKQLVDCVKRRNDMTLTVVQLTSDKRKFTTEVKSGIKTLYCPSVAVPTQKLRDKYYKYVWYLLRPQIETGEDNSLIFHLNYGQEYPLIEMMRRDFPVCKIVFTVHYTIWSFFLNGNVKNYKKIIRKEESSITDEKEKEIYDSYLTDKKIFNAVDKIICLGDYMKPFISKEYNIPESKIVRIYNGLKDEAEFIPEIEKAAIKGKYGFSKNEKIILYVGRLDKIKGIDALIYAFNKIVPIYPDCRLVIVGDGDFQEYFQLAKNNCGKITFTGKLKKSDVYKFYKIADIGIIPSLYEPFGLVATEMMMHRIPIIVSDTSGLSEIVIDGKTGLKVPIIRKNKQLMVNPDILVNRISKLLKEPDLAKQIGKNGRRRFLKQYEAKIFKENMMNFYLSLSLSDFYSPEIDGGKPQL